MLSRHMHRAQQLLRAAQWRQARYFVRDTAAKRGCGARGTDERVPAPLMPLFVESYPSYLNPTNVFEN